MNVQKHLTNISWTALSFNFKLVTVATFLSAYSYVNESSEESLFFSVIKHGAAACVYQVMLCDEALVRAQMCCTENKSVFLAFRFCSACANVMIRYV